MYDALLVTYATLFVNGPPPLSLHCKFDDFAELDNDATLIAAFNNLRVETADFYNDERQLTRDDELLRKVVIEREKKWEMK